MNIRPASSLCASLFIPLAVGAEAALFPFVMGGNEPNAGIADVSWLNEKPAGKHGFVSVRDGHFVDGSGRRIRFLATNFTFGSAFPSHEEADALAARLASKARAAFSTPVPTEDVQPLRATTPEAKIR